MSKQKKKKNKHKKSYPPLSKSDRILSTIMPIISVVFMYTGLFL